MADRLVTGVRRDESGDVIALCSNASWSPRAKEQVIEDIENGKHIYYVPTIEGQRVDIQVVNLPGGKSLRSDPDISLHNYLDDLPECW